MASESVADPSQKGWILVDGKWKWEGISADFFDSENALQAITANDLDMEGKRVLFANVYPAEVDLPDPAIYHGMFAHVHETGSAYFSHSGDWIKLAKQSAVSAGHDSALTQGQIDSALEGFSGGGGSILSSTDSLSEGTTNLYYTDSRADIRATLIVNSATTDNISEGSTNLYHTDARVETVVESTVDSAYVQARQTTAAGHDSALVQAQIDSSISGSAGNPFDQDLNTTDDVEFNKVASNLDGAVIFKAKNESGSPIAKGEAVYISGVSGNTPLVDVADASDSDKMPAFGIAMETASDNSEIEIVTFGDLAGVDTQSYTVGDTLFVGTTPGQITNVKPTGASIKIQNIAYVTKVDNNTGRIKVGGAGRSAATPNLDPGQIFYGNGIGRSTPTLMSDIVDSAYVQDRVSVDSSTTITLIDDYVDSDYVQARSAPQIQSDFVVKTGGFDAAVGRRYYIDTSGGSVTMTLPASPDFGNQVAFVDAGGAFSTTPAILGRNGSNIMGLSSDMSLDVDYFSGTVEYVDNTMGWKLI